MNDDILQKARHVLAERRKAMREAEDPKAVAIMYLQKGGYLNEHGEVAERFRGGLDSIELSKRDETEAETGGIEEQQDQLASW